MAELDRTSIWMMFICPSCDKKITELIDNVDFCMDMDLNVDNDHCVNAWMESYCPHCLIKLTRSLTKQEEEDDDDEHSST